MSDTTTDTTAAPAETQEQPVESDNTPEPDQPDAPEAPDDDGPDWRKDFNPDKAADRIRKLQSEAKNLRDRAKQAEEKAKGVDEKDQQISALEARALRLDVALDLGLPRQIADRLKGNTREEMLADAEELLKLIKAPQAATRRPVEALHGGGTPDREPEETDTRKLAERMFRR